MNASRRPPKKPDPRRIAESAGRAIREQLGEPVEGTFEEGVRAHVQARRMCPETEGACDLGPYIPTGADDGNGAVDLDGEPARPIKFPAWFRRWFAKQNERTLRILDKLIAWLDEHGEDEAEKRLADLDEIVTRHRARRVLVARIKWASIRGGPFASAAFGLVYWGSDKISRTVEQWPVLKGAWKAIMGTS